MMRIFDLLSQALLVSRQDQQATQPKRPEPAPGMMPLDHLLQPMPKFEPRGNHSYDAILSPTADSAFGNLRWNKDPTRTAREFDAAMSESRFRTLAELIDTVVPNCGVTKTTGNRVNVTEMTEMVWQNDKEHVGFTHHGPCEAWIDQTRVYQAPNCRVNHGKYPAVIPIDFNVCEGDCVFKFYWLSVDEPEWHAYKQCAPITTGRNFMEHKKTILKTLAPTTTPAPTTVHPATVRTFKPVKTPAIVALHNTTIRNVRTDDRHGREGDSPNGNTAPLPVSDDDDTSYNSHDSTGTRDSDDSTGDYDADGERDLDDSHDGHRHRYDPENMHDSDDSLDAKRTRDGPRHRENSGPSLPPPSFAFYPLNKSIVFYQPYEFREKEEHQHYLDDSDDKQDDTEAKRGESDNSDDSREDSQNRHNHHSSEQYQRQPSNYQDPESQDGTQQTPPTHPYHSTDLPVITPVIVRRPHSKPEENTTEQNTAPGVSQPAFRLSRLDQNNI